jgi:site-specific DNA recombinase
MLKTYGFLKIKSANSLLIDELTFKRVQKIMHKNFRSKKPSTWKKMPYLLSGRIRCGSCGETLCGKSATGSTKKIAYYEHGSSIKRQSGLSKKFFSCRPIRFSAEKADALVWQKIEELLQKPSVAKELTDLAQKKFSKSTQVIEIKRIKARMTGYSSQIEALTERLSQLPKAVSATPFFNQMEKLENLKRDDESLLQKAQAKQINDVPVTLSSYQAFLKNLNSGAANISHEAKAKIIEKLVHKIELKPDRILIHFFAGASSFIGESFPKGDGSPSFFMSKNQSEQNSKRLSPNQLRAFHLVGKGERVNSSNTIDYGDRGTTRTYDPRLRRAMLYPAELRDR